MHIELEKAQKLLLDHVNPLSAAIQPLSYCWGRVLAEDVISAIDFPPFDRSPLDGYAVCSNDVIHAAHDTPISLKVIDNIPAGSVGSQTVVPGTAARIMTGAPLPPGASGVVRFEDTKSTDTAVQIFAGADSAKNICKQGEEISIGQAVLKHGTVLNAGCMGLLAMLGKAAPLIYQKPTVGILSTGSELVGLNQQLTSGKIRDTNSFMLLAQIQEAGGAAVLLGNVHDDTESIVERLMSSPECDIYITTGGASVGDYDLMGNVLTALGITPLFHRIAIKPGMPVLAGFWKNSLLVGLSGNPAAASVSFEMLVRPVLRKLAGYTDCWRPKATAVLQGDFTKKSVSRRFVWATCFSKGDTLYVTPASYQGNGMLKSMASANALIDIPANSPPLSAGSQVEILMLNK
ncbi:molybdopterin molybdotransferase MoeA [Dendrosporobacter sp. 1207_IL3150]|uniref:molybdopterin molybdotransferase MoeA n=1 Tax=Dendrosporobacter sp. 1207_IL3150 TaxID=3084054 RepID=UPI002FDA5DDF